MFEYFDMSVGATTEIVEKIQLAENRCLFLVRAFISDAYAMHIITLVGDQW